MFQELLDPKPHMSRRIIIEGCDGVGKDTFINRFISFIKGESVDGKEPLDSFGGLNFITEVDDNILVRKKDGKVFMADDPWAWEQANRHPKRWHENIHRKIPRWANHLSVISVHSRDSSPEALDFLTRLDAGEPFTQEQIAEEYLQIHYDLERLCQLHEETYNIVIMNRSLVSYYAMQIQALGLKQYEEKWGKLWRFAEQGDGTFVHLTMPEDKLRERLRQRQGTDFRGEVENLYMEKSRAIEAGFEAIKTDPRWSSVYTVDTSVPIEDYAEVFERIMNNRMRDEVATAWQR